MKKIFTCIKLVLVGLFIIMFVGNNRVLATSQMTVNSLVKSPVNETVDLTVNYHIDGEGDGVYEYMYTEKKENAYGSVINVQQLRMNHKFHSSVDFVDMKLDGLYGVLDSIEVTENHTIDLYYEGDYERLPETVELTVNYHIDGEGDGVYEYMYTEKKENAYGSVVNVQQLRMNHKFHSSVDFVDMKLDGLYGVLDSIEVTENHTIDLYYEGDYERLPETVELTVNYHIDGEGDGIYEYMYTERKENAYGSVVNV